MRTRSFTIRFCIALLTTTLCGAAHAVIIPPTDSNIQYMGRWNFSNPALPTIGWQGGSITVNFSGTGIKATLDADDTASNWEQF